MNHIKFRALSFCLMPFLLCFGQKKQYTCKIVNKITLDSNYSLINMPSLDKIAVNELLVKRQNSISKLKLEKNSYKYGKLNNDEDSFLSKKLILLSENKYLVYDDYKIDIYDKNNIITKTISNKLGSVFKLNNNQILKARNYYYYSGKKYTKDSNVVFEIVNTDNGKTIRKEYIKNVFNFHLSLIGSYIDVSPNMKYILHGQTLPYRVNILNSNLKTKWILDLNELDLDSAKAQKIEDYSDKMLANGFVKNVIEKANSEQNNLSRIQRVFFQDDSTIIVSKILGSKSENDIYRFIDVWRLRKEKWYRVAVNSKIKTNIKDNEYFDVPLIGLINSDPLCINRGLYYTLTFDVPDKWFQMKFNEVKNEILDKVKSGKLKEMLIVHQCSVE